MDEMCIYDKIHDCFLPRIDSYDYCKEHILEDRSAPFRLCTYNYPTNGQRCINTTHKKEGGGLCEEHARLAQLVRQANSKYHKPLPTAESLVVSLAHYAKIEKNAANNVLEVNSTDKLDQTSEEMLLNVETVEGSDEHELTKAIDPFVDIDAFRVNSAISRVMDYASESESDPEPYSIYNIGDLSDSGSEIEGIDEKDDVLRHAGIYSAEEVTLITKEKLIRLQSLYIEQFRRLQHTLREKRRTYLHALKKEKETLSSIHNQSRETAKEQKLYAKLKSLNRYHKRNGIEAVMHKKAHERRALATEGVNVRSSPLVKCTYTEGGVKCGVKTLPNSKHCKKHILSDPNQVLYRACSSDCKEPVVNVFDNTFCVYHTNISTVKSTKPATATTSTIVRPIPVEFNIVPKLEEDSDRELLSMLENSDIDSSMEQVENVVLPTNEIQESTCDNIESKLTEMFGDSENTDTASEINTSQQCLDEL